MKRRIQRFREEWAASSAALERNSAVRARRVAKPVVVPVSDEDSDEDVVVMNAAAVAGNVANSVATFE
ncbi:hypothetical protein [Amycolatopsis keratiniphila]|uniref:Uncharacterized protein n=1 Tax=Amycolatopsis keratiniphila TaxID=129921 RepID=W6HZI3_9PSEU|nr:hypothetical protein [Amycolatopsis keratiniphila]AHJ58537.1 hypothetical protein AORI_P022 [Amycolatopsis keratiniphila]